MAVRPVLRMGHPVLKSVSAPVARFGTPELRELVHDMDDTMRALNGAGIAAPQIGVSLRLFVCDCREDAEDPASPYRRFAAVNPTLLGTAGEVLSEEGCLSIPGLRETVKRHARVKLAAFDLDGRPFELEAGGLVARCIQHEMDHLEGVLFIDRLSTLKRQLLRRQLDSIAAQAAS